MPEGLLASNGVNTPLSINDFRDTLNKRLPIAAISAALCWWWTPSCLRAYARLSRRVLGPATSERLAARVSDFTDSRNQTVAIASRLFIGEKTVEKFTGNIFTKLGLARLR